METKELNRTLLAVKFRSCIQKKKNLYIDVIWAAKSFWMLYFCSLPSTALSATQRTPWPQRLRFKVIRIRLI